MVYVKNVFRAYPFLSNCLTYGTMCVGAEFSQQVWTKKLAKDKTEAFDLGALGRYAVIGTCINPNILYFWYKWLDRKFVGTSTRIVVKKVLLDQFVMTPPLYVIFYVSMSIMERKSDIFEECTAKFIPTFKTSCLFWLPAQTINFVFIPNFARVAYVGTCSFIWLNILCWFKRRNISEEDIKETE